MGKCYIVGAGDFTAICPSDGDTVIAADGGLDHLLRAGVCPDLIVGDLDSVKATLPEGVKRLIFPEKKDETDMHLCYLEGQRLGYHDFVVTGGTGGRPDHTYANFSLLLRISHDKNRAVMLDDRYAYTVVSDGTLSFSGNELPKDKYISVFAIGGRARNVSISGLLYEVEGGVLDPDFPLGVSNKSLGSDALISVGSGDLLIMWER